MATRRKQAEPEPAEASVGTAEEEKEEVYLTGGSEHAVQGEHVEIHQGGAQKVEGKHVEIYQGGAQFIEAETVTMKNSGAINLRAQQVTMEQSGAGVLTSDQANLQKDSSAGVIVAKRVEGLQIRTGLLLAAEVHGNVETAVDSRGALLIGLALALGLGLLASLRSLFATED